MELNWLFRFMYRVGRMYRVQLQSREMQYDDGDTTSTTILQLELQVLYQDVCFEGDTISKDRIVAPC